MSAARFAPLLLSALCLSACAATLPGEAVGHYPEVTDKPGGGPPMASLPAVAGRVVAVRRTPYTNGVGQEIVLEGPRAMVGENRITVQALTTSQTGARDQGGEELKLTTPSDVAIADEMERRLPGIAMSIAAAPEHDSEGTIGYATGSKGRLSCVYAWQYLASERPLSFLEGLSDTGSLPVSVRVRLCREQPVAALLETLRGLRIARPNGALRSVPARAAATGDELDAAIGSVPGSVAPTGITAPKPGRHAVKLSKPARRRTVTRFKPQLGEAPSSVLPRLPEPDQVQPGATLQRSSKDALPLPGAAGDTL